MPQINPAGAGAVTRVAAALLALALASCGGGSPAGPSGPPTPAPVPGHSVTAVVFYDENANGTLDSSEQVRIPNADVVIGGHTARSATGTGQAVVDNVAAGAQTATVNPASLPPYYAPGPPVPVQVPPAVGSTLFVPVTLPIGGNRVNTYLLFGDSITAGEGSSDETGYGGFLRADLRNYLGQGSIVVEGLPGSKSDRGNSRLGAILSRTKPAYTLILYGTNDWNDNDCKIAFPCFTIDSLRGMIAQTRATLSLPVIATLPPVNPQWADRNPPERIEWVTRMNELIRTMARQEGATLADVHAAFLKAPSLPPLFADHIHPNDQGYAIMGHAFFQAIANPRGTSATAQP